MRESTTGGELRCIDCGSNCVGNSFWDGPMGPRCVRCHVDQTSGPAWGAGGPEHAPDPTDPYAAPPEDDHARHRRRGY